MLKTSISILSLVIVMSIMACSGLRPFPTDSIYVIDVGHQVCGMYQINDFNSFHVQWVRDLPLKSCDGNVSLARKDYLPVKKWIEDTISKYQECKTK